MGPRLTDAPADLRRLISNSFGPEPEPDRRLWAASFVREGERRHLVYFSAASARAAVARHAQDGFKLASMWPIGRDPLAR